MPEERTGLGRIALAPRAIARIASQTALQSYGVVGMASKSFADGLAHILVRDPDHGVEIRSGDGSLMIDLYVILQYGTPIGAVAENLTQAVRFQVERLLGIPVAEVHVHVQALHMDLNP